MGYVIAYVLGLLTASHGEDHHGENIGDDIGAEDGETLARASITKFDVPPAIARYYKGRIKKQGRRECIKFWVEVGGLVVLAVYAGFTIATWWQVRRSADAANDAAVAAKIAADVARKQLEMSERPWVVANATVISPLVFSSNGNGTVHIMISLSNIGHSVATDVQTHIAGGPWVFGDTNGPMKQQKEMCDMWRDKFPGTGEILFPSQAPYRSNTQLTFSKDQFVKARVTPKANYFVSIVIYGCIDYRFTFSRDIHETGFIWEIVKPGKGNVGSTPMDYGKDIPANQLAMRPYLFGGTYIN